MMASKANAEPGVPAAPSVATFTPGPWRIEEHQPKDVRLTRRHWAVGQIYAPARGVALAFGGTEANARLIASAPELYAQLADAKVTLEEAAKLLAERYPSVANNIVNQCAIRCGDALAKAVPQTGPMSDRTAPNTDESKSTDGHV